MNWGNTLQKHASLYWNRQTNGTIKQKEMGKKRKRRAVPVPEIKTIRCHWEKSHYLSDSNIKRKWAKRRWQKLKRMLWKYNDSHSNNKTQQFLKHNFYWNTRRQICRLHIVGKMTHSYEMYVCSRMWAYPRVNMFLQKYPKHLFSYCLAHK